MKRVLGIAMMFSILMTVFTLLDMDKGSSFIMAALHALAFLCILGVFGGLLCLSFYLMASK